MKRLAALIPAAVALAAGVCCIPAVSASAEDITLTKEETRALFSDHIYCNYVVSPPTIQEMSFDFIGYGTISHFNYTPDSNTFWHDPTGDNVLIYRSSDTPTIPFYNNDGTFDIKIFPVIDLSGLNYISFSTGISTDSRYDEKAFYNYSDFSNKCPFFNMFVDNSLTVSRTPYRLVRDVYYPVSAVIDVDGSVLTTYYSSFTQYSYTSTTDAFRAFCSGDGSSGLHQAFGVGKTTAIDSTFNNYYLFVSTVKLSSGYVNNLDSSGGGSESSGGGYDGPDYTDQLALILAKLDLIINNNFNIDVDLSADLSGLESRLDGVNSRLDDNNSRIDGNNSRLDGVNSRLDGVNSRLDNISGELHGLNSAPNETLPNTGGENSEFEHNAEMYMSDFKNEFEDSENQVFEVIDKGTGFLGFVRELIISSHLAQILPLVALLFIAHYVIFERGG